MFNFYINNPKLANCWLISSYPKMNGECVYNGNSPGMVPNFKDRKSAPSYLPLNRSPGNLHVCVGLIKVDVIISRRGGDWLGLVTWTTVEGLVAGKDSRRFSHMCWSDGIFGWYCDIDDDGETWTGSWLKGTKRNTLMHWFCFCMCWRQTVPCFESFWWEIWMRHNVEHQFSPLVIGPLQHEKSLHMPKIWNQKKNMSMHGYCKQRPVNSTELGCFSIHKGFLYMFSLPGLWAQWTSTTKNPIGARDWRMGNEVFWWKTQSKNRWNWNRILGFVSLVVLYGFYHGTALFNHHLVEYINIYIYIFFFFSQAFFSANPRQDGSDMKFEISQHNYFTCIDINYMILSLWFALAIVILFGDCHESFDVEITKQSIFLIEILCKFLLSQVCAIKTQKRCSTIFPSGNLSV